MFEKFVKANYFAKSMQRDDDTMVCSSPLVSILEGQGLSGSQSSMPVTDGFVGNIKVKVLRDNGCNAVIVKNSLIESRQLKSESQTCVLADGTRRTFQIATIQVDTPFFQEWLTHYVWKTQYMS